VKPAIDAGPGAKKEVKTMRIRVKAIGVFTTAFLLSAAITLIPIGASAQQGQRQPTQEEIMQMMGPMMGQMMEMMMESMLTVIARPETAQRLATFTKNYYDALIAKGFSKEEALEIVTSMGIPAVPAMK
jgi:hypothetical protein